MENTVQIKKRLNPKLTRRRSTANTWPDEIPLEIVASDASGISGTGIARIDSATNLTATLSGTNQRAVTFPVVLVHGDPETKDLQVNDDKVVYSALNVPMLLIWLNSHHDEAVTVLSGLEFVLHHALQGEGCVLLLKHGIVKVLNKILGHADYRDNESIQLLCVQTFKQLLECNYTRDPLITRTDVLRTTFAIGANLDIENKLQLTIGVNLSLLPIPLSASNQVILAFINVRFSLYEQHGDSEGDSSVHVAMFSIRSKQTGNNAIKLHQLQHQFLQIPFYGENFHHVVLQDR